MKCEQAGQSSYANSAGYKQSMNTCAMCISKHSSGPTSTDIQEDSQNKYTT